MQDSTLTAVPGPPDRILELDAVRGLAACAVLVCHLPRGFWFGETGVDLFFVLSGYLITGIILRQKDRPGFLRRFYIRRALRIFPVYYLAIAVVLVLNALRRSPEPTDGMWYYLAYLQNVWCYWGATGPQIGLSLGHTWTLAIEEQFYLIWPALLLLLPRRWAVAACIVLTVLPLGLRWQGLDRVTLLGHTDGLAMGGLLALLGQYRRAVYRPANAVLFGALAGITAAAYVACWIALSAAGGTGKEMARDPLGIALISATYTGVIGVTLCIAGTQWGRWLRLRPLIWIGTVSYGLYLYHWIIYELLDTVLKFGQGHQDSWWMDALKVGISVVAAGASWYLIEGPLLRFKERVTGARPRSACPGAGRDLPTPSLVTLTNGRG